MKAIDAWLARKAEIDALLARIQAHSDEHFEHDPDNIDWGHVGTLADVATKLQNISDSLFGEGEYKS